MGQSSRNQSLRNNVEGHGWLDPAVFHRLPLPYAAGWLAAQSFLKYRRGGGAKTSPLPDFYIGSHAEIEKRTLITRDAARYRTYFPNVVLIAPT
jgi:predicted nucleic acid-binding protein